MPQSFMGRHQTFHTPAPIVIGREWTSGEHHFENVQQLVCNLKI